MEFEPKKSELMHFTRAREPCPLHVRLGDTVVPPVTSARFLGVWLDRKLRWKDHISKLKAKMATQTLALTRLAASAWGCSVPRARELYTKVIRSALSYGASAWHQMGDTEKGPALQLRTVQNSCLRTVTGAYKAIPVRHLETEVYRPLRTYI